MLRLETKSDLQRLVDDEILESLTLDYKKSPALAKDSASRDELCKDVSAFANSAGGRIIYGIPEKDQKPQPLDSGVPNDKISREWISTTESEGHIWRSLRITYGGDSHWNVGVWDGSPRSEEH
jgi:predicted HTH transcriptional regulator